MNDATLRNTIESYIFLNNSNIHEYIIPDNINIIDKRAFFNCHNLTKITLPNSLEIIESSAFSGCENLLEITLPQNIKKLGSRAFADCKRLKKITLLNGLTEIGKACFAGCENLEEITIPDSIKELPQELFLNCKKLKKVVLPKHINHLPDNFFKNCHNLKFNFSSNITSLGNNVFENCYKLEEYPNNVKKLGVNCFANCRNIKEANLNENISFLPDGTFNGCINLNEIICNHKISIGKKTFKNCKSLKNIPECIINFNDQAFENCTGLTSITIIDPYIKNACFRGCTNLSEIIYKNEIKKLDAFCFSGCTNLKSIYLDAIDEIPAEAFSNCKNLEKVAINSLITRIKTKAFYNCTSLSKINIPDTVKTIGAHAFQYCNSITTLKIPDSLILFGKYAFSNMDNLTKIETSPNCKEYFTPDNKILINKRYQRLDLYASGLKYKTFSLEDYNVKIDALGRILVSPLNGIGPTAFSGNKYLQELTLGSCFKDIEYTAFDNCNNLKTLTIKIIPFYTTVGLNLRNNGVYLYDKEANIPFETIIIANNIEEDENLVSIFSNAFPQFKNVKKVILPINGSYTILTNAFSDCKNLSSINIPSNVSKIDENSFNSKTELIFENGLKINNLKKLYTDSSYNGNYKLYILNKNKYFIEDEGKLIFLTENDIKSSCSNSDKIINEPILFYDFTKDLIKHDLYIDLFKNGYLYKEMNLTNRKILLDNIKKDDIFTLNIIRESGLLDKEDYHSTYLLHNFNKLIDFINLYKKYNITNSILYNKLIFAICNVEDIENIIKDDLNLLIHIIKTSELLNVDKDKHTNTKDGLGEFELTDYILAENTLNNFIKYVKKYNIKDQFLLDKPFIMISNNTHAESFFRNFNANTKRLIKKSLIFDNYSSIRHNIFDLLTLLKITGALEDDEITRQKATTFITEKIFDSHLPNGKHNKYHIVKDDIHRIFNFDAEENFNKDFAEFFMENYKKVLSEEFINQGFIERVYKNFNEISKTSTSNKGSQRKLKVTFEKCRNFLLKNKFTGVNKKNIALASTLSKWYDTDTPWFNALIILKESQMAPRNIFTKITYDDENNPIYDNDKKHDLKENINENFSYEWLPKQNYDNFLLGKYCNCCAHLEGAGMGIMRASMILDNCQNLVIRNESGVIIAKSTLYINKDEGYGVFNNVETSLNYRDENSTKKIYDTFIRGTNAFLDAYNKNNNIPINTITIGENRNTLIDYLDIDKHPKTFIHKALNYASYSLNGAGYNGDWMSNQRIVVSRERKKK